MQMDFKRRGAKALWSVELPREYQAVEDSKTTARKDVRDWCNTECKKHWFLSWMAKNPDGSFDTIRYNKWGNRPKRDMRPNVFCIHFTNERDAVLFKLFFHI